MAKNKTATSPVPSSEKKVKLLTFLEAMEAILNGQKVRRQEWAEESEHCLMHDQWLCIHRNDKFHGWTVSEGDVMAKDWVIVK